MILRFGIGITWVAMDKSERCRAASRSGWCGVPWWTCHYVLSKRLRARMPKVFDMCAAYHADLVAQSNAQGKAKANTTQGKAKANSAQDIDFNHWISDKVLLTYTDFRQVRHIIGSPALDDVLTEEIEITSTV
ncbi:hypothetical protein K466DRAFT_87162 [Polyporus arcularius HHB13444]|uniref:Uncharacterized protein n=1 Tax=Polyporus arcularius HHB13444 TaxID=1314778 RepID=A0A5C3PIR3_9APHY|nr:hypothetical protein K466DRAFT_87162 [Polyporus arcularius HHB13444]